MSSRRVLLIAFQYPPYAEVGAKRWTKMSKYLAEDDVELFVLSASWDRGDNRLLEQVSSPHIHIARPYCPGFHNWRRKSYDTATLNGRAANSFRRRILGLAARFGLADDARLWGPWVVPAAEKLIEQHDIDVVVATGAPFWSCLWVTRLKRKHPSLRLVQDVRDPWAGLPAVQEGPASERERVERLEADLVAAADAIVTVTEPLSDTFAERYPSANIVTVRNGFDPDDFTVKPERRPRAFTILHAGNLYAGRQEPAAALLRAVREVHTELDGLQVLSYGGFPPALLHEFSDLVDSGTLAVHDRVSAEEVAEHMGAAFACLHVNARGVPFALSTKIYEYAYAGRPVLSVNYGGISDAFVRDHGLGWSVDGDDRQGIVDALRDAYRMWTEDPSLVNEPTGLEAYEYRQLARDYADVLFG